VEQTQYVEGYRSKHRPPAGWKPYGGDEKDHVITTEPVWSVIIVLAIGLAGTLYCVYTILKISNEEMNK
jgi:hypothetical protein